MQRRTKVIALAATALTITIVMAVFMYAGQKHAEATRTAEIIATSVESTTPQALVAAINRERTKAGVQPIAIEPKLNGSSQIKSDDMLNKNYFSHADPSGKQGYTYAGEAYPEKCAAYASENIYISDNATRGTDEALSKWMASESHRQAILDPKYKITGFGISSNKDKLIIVEHFC